MDRRDFLKLSLTGMAAIAVGSVKIPGVFQNQAHAADNIINLTMMEADVQMFDATLVYHWVYAADVSPVAARNSVRGMQEQVTPVAGPAGTQLFPSFPGPAIFATAGDTITLNITNNLPANVPHAFQVVGTKIKTGPIPAGQTRSITFKVPEGGTYMYIDPLNAPINRVMGLHGALVSLPAAPAAGHRETPYSKPTPAVQQIFDDLGNSPELPPNAADVTLNNYLSTVPANRGGWFLDPAHNRFRFWFLNSTDPTLNEEIRQGIIPTPAEFRRRYVALYMMMNGRAGGYCAHHHDVTVSAMIGQPHLLRFLNAGMVQHSCHIHGNHVWVMAINNQVRDNVFTVDVWSVRPMDRIDWMLPFRMPPDIPNKDFTGAKHSDNAGRAFQVPPEGNLATAVRDELEVRPIRNGTTANLWPAQRPIPYPMHCHSEPSQAGAGGNYPGGLVTVWEITGDVNGIPFEVSIGPDDPDPTIYTNDAPPA
ncbi:MAG: multicopper oxidase type [Geobacteraceae bacterium]|nr:MAG: multicopper oxidase type [Geobacteraceae bacterium]